jgi:hypothetical protein
MIAALLLSVLLAQTAPKDEKKPVYTALVGGDVQTVTQGLLKGGTILIKDDKIFKIGPALDLPEGTVRIDVAGKRVLPGFIAASARNVGLTPAAGKIADAVDPFSESIKLALSGGITSVYVEPSAGGGGVFGGTPPPAGPGAVIKMSYGSLEGMVLAEPAGVSLAAWINGGPSERYEVRENLVKARAALEKERDFDRRRSENKLKPDEKPPRATGVVETYVRLLKGELAARIPAPHVDDLHRALELINEFRFKAVLTEVIEGWTMADEIGRARAYCLVEVRAKEHAPRNSIRPAGSSIEQAALLRKAGVKFALLPPNATVGTGGTAGRDLLTLPLDGAFAIRGGLDEQTALEAITITAAEICGVDSRVGSLEEGKDADIVVLDGDPFDYRTFVELTFVNGKLLYEKSKSPYFSHLQKAR